MSKRSKGKPRMEEMEETYEVPEVLNIMNPVHAARFAELNNMENHGRIDIFETSTIESPRTTTADGRTLEAQVIKIVYYSSLSQALIEDIDTEL